MNNIEFMEAMRKKKDYVNLHRKNNTGYRNKSIQRKYWERFNNKFIFGVDVIDCSNKDIFNYAEYIDGHRNC